MPRDLVRLLIGIVMCMTLAGAAGPLAAQAGTLHGTIADSTGGALASASVTVEGTGLAAVSGGTGEYKITGVPAGPHTVYVRLIGYRA
ncbi:MAG TPA: carboxypeptidase regulatory-like domain-containing protein, partial [Gemmatimonadales bacterium]|nr:carboxypeptidase regulatory-like domain-containing protein [Gemmatimonadales bacterium]